MNGKHRKPRPLTVAARTTGALVAGAALVGTVAATAQAAVPVPGKDAPQGALSVAGTAVQPKGGPVDLPRELKVQRDEPKTDAPKADVPSKKGDGGTDAPSTGRPTAHDAIRLAESQVGISESRHGNTKFQDWYMTTDRARETVRRDGGSVGAYRGANWCDMFVSWVGEKIGFSDQFGSDAWTVEHADWFKENGRWGTRPKPGAIVFFDWSGGGSINGIEHVGMVVKDNRNGTIDTVEGNAGNAVRKETRDTGSVVGYGYPNYRR
ncbi:CHAP domain-containing protein [Actinomadura rayongensis]|uniref:CHAP domain-containing protein n=1 Tax=Actinomadura rayongensis TaxID=1429076 RepID=A0A6I4W6R3_9ACTN|nr:CHAP domain-containing protein [Actinomadura rayongensis]MXQ63896.1 CHAP domain-containing protein [Actinomadura rayongensis]